LYDGPSGAVTLLRIISEERIFATHLTPAGQRREIKRSENPISDEIRLLDMGALGWQ